MNLTEKYQESTKYSSRSLSVYEKSNQYIVERTDNGNLHGQLRILRYYPKYDKFGIIVDEEMHYDLFEGFKDVSDSQFKRTVELYESSDITYFWTFVKDRLGEIWHTEEDIEKIEEILDHLRKL